MLGLARPEPWAEAILGNPAQHGVQRADVLGRGAAAAADDGDAVLGDEPFGPAGQLVGRQRIVGLAAAQLGQPGIGQARDQAAPVAGQMADMLGHLLGTGGAVEPHDRNVERIDDRRGRGDVGADQHGAGGLDRDLDHQRQLAATSDEGMAAAVDRGLDLQRILAGLDQQGVRRRRRSAPRPGPRAPPRARGRRCGRGWAAWCPGRWRPRRTAPGRHRRSSPPPRAPARAARSLISNARASRPNSPRVIGEPPKLLVSTASAPAAR